MQAAPEFIHEIAHKRKNILTGDWVLVSPHRAKRPWLGQVEKETPHSLPDYDPACYLCPGNTRVAGAANPQYQGTYVFDNDFQALSNPAVAEGITPLLHAFYQAEPVTGVCRVVCFSPSHHLSFPELLPEQAAEVIRTWRAQTLELSNRKDITYVQVFENKGAMMGCSNPHPHSQLWATNILPNESAKELASQQSYLKANHTRMLQDYLKAELKEAQRLVCENASFVSLVPFWAVWPFETMILPKFPASSLLDLDDNQIKDLADIYQQTTSRYDNLFEISFPYSMGIHQQPFDGQPHPEWQLHLHFYPPLLRSAAVRKFMVGYEMMAMPQRDITPEQAAARLRGLPALHYKKH
ncbi:MAG: UDP-glucose--hexose-1-phosphate uridylyltransferase [Anaerolineaceae bacterium]|nr:UDP-glucose--hexose-1-phosphate uridylyltransferase [Anaerolineaceae bacterium]